MLPIHKIASLGGALDAVGRAAVPSAPAPLPRSAPRTTPTSFDGYYLGFDGLRTVDESRVDHAAAAGWQQRAPTFGRVIGLGIGVAGGTLLLRALRAALGVK